MNHAPLDERYLLWLYKQIGYAPSRNPSRTHWKLVRQLYTKEFVWFVPNDDNRVADGKELRRLFVREEEIVDPDPDWMGLGCSMLEMLLALSYRLEFLTNEEPRDWFWNLIENIGIGMQGSSDRHYNKEIEKEIDEALDRVIWRTYSKTGEGGLFPVPETALDQCKIEIWYQISAYLADDF